MPWLGLEHLIFFNFRLEWTSCQGLFYEYILYIDTKFVLARTLLLVVRTGTSQLGWLKGSAPVFKSVSSSVRSLSKFPWWGKFVPQTAGFLPFSSLFIFGTIIISLLPFPLLNHFFNFIFTSLLSTRKMKKEIKSLLTFIKWNRQLFLFIARHS